MLQAPSRRLLALALAVASLAVVAPARAAADDESPPDKPYWRTNLFKRFAYDQKFLVTAWFPAELKRPAFTAPLLGAILVAASSEPDEGGWDPAQQWEFASDRTRTQVQIAHGLTTFGNSPFVAAALGITYLASRRAGNDHLAETASLSAEALLDVGLWTIALKEVASRARPGPQSQGAFFQYGATRSGSFPSGHAAVAFSIATVIAGEYRQRKWVPWVAYGTATLIGAARVALGQHYPSDVLFGATLGHSIGSAVLARQGDHEGTWYDRVTPSYDPSKRAWGLSYQKRW